MDSFWAVLFVVVATILSWWLLFDEDHTELDSGDFLPLRIAETPGDPAPTSLSKSA